MSGGVYRPRPGTMPRHGSPAAARPRREAAQSLPRDRPLAEGPRAHRGRGSADARAGRTTPSPTTTCRARIGARFEALVERRATGEPIPYIKGYAEFRGLELLTKPGVFVPRDSSEFLAEQAIRRLRRRKHAGARRSRDRRGHDRARGRRRGAEGRGRGAPTSRATRCASRARTRRRSASEARFEVGDLFDALPKRLRGSVDVITLHPPYVPARRDRRPARRDPRLGAGRTRSPTTATTGSA